MRAAHGARRSRNAVRRAIRRAGRGQRASDAFGPPLAVRARVAVAEAGDFVALPGDQEDEVVARRVHRQALTRPVVGEGAGAERRAVHLAELRRERQRVDGLDWRLDVKCTRTRGWWLRHTAHLARVGLERRHRYALRPTRTTCLV